MNLSFSISFIFMTIMINAQKNNLAPSRSITDEYFGIKVEDKYRNLENLNDPSTSKWMKDQTSYSLSVINNISNRQYYINKRLELDQRKSFSVNNITNTENDFYFYLKAKPGEKVEKLFYRHTFNGEEIEIFDPKDFKPEKKKNYQINYIKPNYDGSKVAIALTESGKEIAEMIIYDVISHKLLPDIITNCWPSDGPGISWLPDNNSIVYLYYPDIDPKSEGFLKNMESVIYKIGNDPKQLNVILSKKNNPDIKINSEDFPNVILPSKDCNYLIGEISGAVRFKDTYYQSLQESKTSKKWKLLFSKEDKIRNYIIKGDNLIYVSEKDGINSIYSTSLKKIDLKNSQLIVNGIKDETITNIYNIKDGFVYSTSKNGVEAKLYLYINKNELLQLPIAAGSLKITTQSNFSNDFWIVCSGWKNGQERFKYNHKKKEFIPENLSPLIEYPEFKDIVVEEITVKSYDGQDIPLSLIYQKGIKKDGNNPTLIDAYGAYGISYGPFFSRIYLLWALQGGVVAIAHVRGGGEKGEQWHQGGFKETKPNSWKDLISSAEFLIKEGFTKREKLGIWGGSAGGITVGRAMTERPDLFKAVIIDAGIVNSVRMEFAPNGLNTAKEFGSLSKESEFKSLLEMDAYQHIKKGVKYPATLITSGINDPRVPSWMPTKFAAKLMDSNSSDNPILLKIDYEGGHGGDVLINQQYSNIADVLAFAFWQLGHSDYKVIENSKSNPK